MTVVPAGRSAKMSSPLAPRSEFDGTARHISQVGMAAWTGFLDGSRMLEERLAAQLHDDFEMSHREYEVLVRLDGSGGRLRMSDLATQMVASQPLMSQTVNRLEKRGWVRREASTSDRRSIETLITRDGRLALGQAAGPHADLIKSLLIEMMNESDLEIFSGAMKIIADHLRNHRKGLPCSRSNCPLN